MFYLQIEDTDFSVCVVLDDSERYTEFAAPDRYPSRVLYHRTDLSTNRPAQCDHFNRLAYKGNKLVFFSI